MEERICDLHQWRHWGRADPGYTIQGVTSWWK